MLPEIDELATVVVCEDDEPTRELLCDHLTADRYRVLSAPSAGGRFDPGLPVIVLTGRGTEADKLRCFGAGADDFLQKPTH